MFAQLQLQTSWNRLQCLYLQNNRHTLWNNFFSFSRDLIHGTRWTNPPFRRFVYIINDVTLLWITTVLSDKLGWRYIEGVRRGSNTQVYSTAIKFKIGYVSFSTCSHEKFKPEMYKIVLNKGTLRSCGSFLILFWVFCGCHKITTVIYFFWTIFTGFLPVS